jgi:5'(3')-deoxyribonucleotidase
MGPGVKKQLALPMDEGKLGDPHAGVDPRFIPKKFKELHMDLQDITRLNLDMDSITVALTSHWLRQIELHHGVRASLEDVTEWSMHRIEPFKKAGLKSEQIYDYFFDRESFWAEAPVMPGAREFVKSLQPAIERGVLEVSFATTPSGGASAKAKIEWLERVFGKKYADKAYVGGPKGRIICDLLVDDRLRTAEELLSQQPQAHALVPVYPYVQTDLDRIALWSRANVTNREFPTCEVEMNKPSGVVGPIEKGERRLHFVPDPERSPGIMWQEAKAILHRIIRSKVGERRWEILLEDKVVMS